MKWNHSKNFLGGTYRCLNFVQVDNGKGFDMDLISIDTIWYNGEITNIMYASRDWKISAHWIFWILQKLFGKKEKGK